MKRLALLIISTTLIACSEKDYTVDEFLKNDELRSEWIKKCDNGEVRPELLNCINAKKAADKIRNHNRDFFLNFGKAK